jgi:hypothetical protein
MEGAGLATEGAPDRAPLTPSSWAWRSWSRSFLIASLSAIMLAGRADGSGSLPAAAGFPLGALAACGQSCRGELHRGPLRMTARERRRNQQDRRPGEQRQVDPDANGARLRFELVLSHVRPPSWPPLSKGREAHSQSLIHGR